MKPKKKTVAAQKKVEKKHPSVKPLLLIDKTMATTKYKTNTTIEDHFQIAEFRHSTRTNKNITPRDNCQQKLKDKDMSPFSSSGAQSISPKYRKIISPRSQNDKKIRAKSNLLLDKPCQKIKGEFIKKEGKIKQKMTKEQFNQTNYQNLLLRKMNEKKITEMSDQSSSSIPKISRLKLNIVNHQIKPNQPTQNKTNFSQLKQRIAEKYKRQLPNLRAKELKFICSIILIQRIWRQNRIKNLINAYISPRGIMVPTLQSHSVDRNMLRFEQSNTQQQTLQLIKKYHSPITHQINKTSDLLQGSLDLNNLELSSQLTCQQQVKMVKFVQCLRDISFHKPKKHNPKSKINIFTLRQSLSEKCVMQAFYSKIVNVGQIKKNNFQIFNLKKDEKNLQRSIQLIKTMKSPQKIEIDQRFETQLQQNQSLQPLVQKVSISVQTQSIFFQKRQTNKIRTIQQLNLLTETILFNLLHQASEDYQSFTFQPILRKKKMVRMPGLKVNTSNIREYLSGLAAYMISQYDGQILRRWDLVKPINFIKIHHEYNDDQYIDQVQQSQNPVIPNNIFYEYQLIYEENVFRIQQEDKKYCNFLEGLIKIHNLLLATCMSEILQKIRMDRVILPWDIQIYSPNKHYSKANLQKDLQFITNTICQYSSIGIGQFHKRLDDVQEQKKMLKCVNEQYKNDWNCQYQYMQARMELSQSIQHQLLMQAVSDFIVFF